MRRALIIYNPAAGRFSVRPFISGTVQELQSAGWKAEAVETKSGAHAVELAKQAAYEKMDAAFAVGGDGTIGQVASGLLDSDTALGVLPAGTANVLAVELGLPIFPGQTDFPIWPQKRGNLHIFVNLLNLAGEIPRTKILSNGLATGFPSTRWGNLMKSCGWASISHPTQQIMLTTSGDGGWEIQCLLPRW